MKGLITFLLSNGQELEFKSLGHALEYCSKNKLKIVRSF